MTRKRGCLNEGTASRIFRSLRSDTDLISGNPHEYCRMVTSSSLRHLWFPFLASIPTATFLLLGFFTGPTADDFCYANGLIEVGYFEALKTDYMRWQGRYASSSLLFLNGYLDHSAFLNWYWLIPTSLIMAIIFSTY